MKTIYILKGLPASGKSTWAKKLVKENPNSYKRINKDDLRMMLDDNHWSKGNEKFVLKIRDMMIIEALHAGKHIISDDTNLAPKHEARFRAIAKEFTAETGQNIKIEVKFFDVSVEECIRRDLLRNRSVGEQVIRRMYNDFINPRTVKDRPFLMEQDKTLPKAIICDLDGTLALMNRNPFDASTCEEDLLNESIANIVKNYHKLAYKIILLTGRQAIYRPPTERWLAKYNIPYDVLLTRKEKDTRKDAIIKKEIFETEIKPKYFVELVLDDRNQVVDMWREIGLTCCQVYYGDF